MKPTLEIAPEVRGLLEEIVADPRSSLRLVPRSPLRLWFDRGESLRTADIAQTRAERHLVEVHREELARLLREAATIAYWKAPEFGHFPNDEEGGLLDPSKNEPSWQVRAGRFRASCRGVGDTGMLSHCLSGIDAQKGHELAKASLALAPNDTARYCLAALVPSEMPRTAIVLLNRLLARLPDGESRGRVLFLLARRLCAVGQLQAARTAYLKACELGARRQVGLCYAFNLSCALGQRGEVMELSEELDSLADKEADVLQACEIIKHWASSRPDGERMETRAFVSTVIGGVSPAGQLLCEAILR